MNTLLSSDVCKGCAAFKAQLVIQLLHPLEVIRTRLQSHDGGTRNLIPNYKNSALTAVKQILQQEGMAGLYRGGVFSLMANCTSQFMFFMCYTSLSHSNSIMASSMFSGILVVLLTQPLWTIKTRLLLTTQPLSITSCLSQVQSQHGLPGFYRGLLASLLLCSNGIIQLNIYELLDKQAYQDSSQVKYLAFLHGSLAKILATLLTYPLTTIRTRYQQDQYHLASTQKYSGYTDILSKTFYKEGISGFYKGVCPSLIKSVPQSGLFFFLYEFFKNNVDQCVQ